MVLRSSSSSLLLVLVVGFAFEGPARDVARAPIGRLTASCPQLPSGAEPDVLEPSAVLYAVSVTPKGGNQTWGTGTFGHKAVFTITNTGTCTDNFSFSYTAGAPLSGVTLSQSSASLGPNQSTTDTATFNTTYSASATLTLTAAGNVGTESDSGYYSVTVTSNGPTISLAPHDGDYRDVTKCVAGCFDAVAGYATPPYFSWDAPHSVQLIYRSAQAKAVGVVQVDAKDSSSVNPTKLSIQLRNYSTGVNVTSERFYRDTTHGVSRLATQFDASGLTTGSYTYLLALRSYRSDNSFRENDVLVTVLVLNESSSPFGAGWSIAGFQHVYTQSGGLVISEGNGSVGYFAGCTTGCTLTSPKGDFTTVSSVGTVGADSAKYYRRYPDGTTFAFRTDGRLWYVKDRFNNQMQFRYNASNLLVAITDPAGKTDSLGYVSNKLRWIKDPGGRADSFTVDASGNLTQIKDRVGGLPFQQGTYDGNHHLLHWTDRRGGAWGVAYDFAWKVAADTAPQVTANGQAVRPVSSFASIEKKVLIDTTTGSGTSTNPGANVDTSTVRASTTNPRGFTTTYALDRFGAPTLVQEPLGRTTAYVRDSNSAVAQMTAPSGHIMNYVWSGSNLTQVRDGFTNRQINYRYETTFNQDTLVYGDVDTVHNRWNSGHLDSVRVGGSSVWARYFYAANGRITSDTDPGGHFVTRHYQSSGFQNTDTVRYTIGKTVSQYDGHGRLTNTTDSLGHSATTLYDSLGRATRVIGTLQDTTASTYDSLYVVQVRDAKGQTYKSWVDALGWVDSTTDPRGNVDRYQYDLNGNRTSWTNRRAQTIQFTYDSLDQPRLMISGSDTTKFYSDPAGHYTAVVNRESADTVRLDGADRVLWQISCRVLVSGSSAQCLRDSSAYSIRNLPIALVVFDSSLWGPSKFSVGYHYTYYDKLDTLTNFAGEKALFSYTQELFEAGHTLLGLNSLNVSYGSTYVWTHRFDQLQLSDTALNRALGWGYGYDAVGRVNQVKHGPYLKPDTVRALAYDAASELTGYTDTKYTYTQQIDSNCVVHNPPLAGDPCPDTSNVQNTTVVGSGSYTYDSVGNRTDQTAPSGGLALGNRLQRWQYFRMTYDSAGNLVVKLTLKTDTIHTARLDSLFWGAVGRLDSVHTTDSLGHWTHVGLGYDGWGRRVRKSTATNTTSTTSRYIWDGDALVMQLDSLGNRVAEYTYFPGTDNPESVVRHNPAPAVDTTYYYLQDNPGKVVALLKKSGSTTVIANQYGYDPFGVPQGGTVTVPDALQYAGREYDSETQLYYNRARYYDPSVGRFISEDPAGLSAGLNLYAYAGNDPIDGRDPSGLCNGSGEEGASSGSGDKEKNATRKSDYVACQQQAAILAAEALLAEQGFQSWDQVIGAVQDNFGGDMFCDASGCGQGYTGLFTPDLDLVLPFYNIHVAPGSPLKGCPDARLTEFQNIPLNNIEVPEKGLIHATGHATMVLNHLTPGGWRFRIYSGVITIYVNGLPGSSGGDVKFLDIRCENGEGTGSGALAGSPF